MASEMDRILSLPVDTRTGDDLVDAYTDRFRVPGGNWTIHPHQALALEYIEELGGAFLPIDIGGGKTLIGMAAPKVLGVPADKVVVLCNAGLRDEAEKVHHETREHFDVPLPRYVSYTELSRNIDLLTDAQPRLIIADEVHALKNKKAARTRRFLAYMKANPDVGFVAMTGTPLNRSILECAHLVELALGERSPLPSSYTRLQRWSRCLDVDPVNPPSSYDWRKIMELYDAFEDELGDHANTLQAKARAAFHYRLKTSPGVVLTEGSSCDAPIRLSRITDVEVPPAVEEALRVADDVWEMPNGDEILSPLEKASKMRQLAQGFHYYWDWPDGTPDFKWLSARTEYNQFINHVKNHGPAHLDTPMLVENAIEDGEIPYGDAYATWHTTYADYEAPPQAVNWMSDYLIDDALARATPGTLIWYAHREVGERLAERIPTAMAGEDVPLDEDVVGVSVHSHATGLNLQYDFTRHLILCSPSNGGLLHQLIGRIHRFGFAFDEVIVDIYAHTPELASAIDQAFKDAKMQKESLQIENKLLLAA